MQEINGGAGNERYRELLDHDSDLISIEEK